MAIHHSISTPSTIMLKFNTCPNRTLTHLKCLSSPQQSPSSLHFDPTPFQVSYLINNLDFSPQSASKLCSIYRVGFKTTQKPDSAISFLTDYGFSDSQIHDMVARSPWLLSCNFSTRVLPKFEFFLSKGASDSDIIKLFSKNSRVLSHSLENHIIPTYELIYRFLQSDKDVIAAAIKNPYLLCHLAVPRNILLLIDKGVSDSNIARLLRVRSWTMQARDMLSLLKEIKDLGFNPLKTTFTVALIAKTSVTKTRWGKKVKAYKEWGWTDKDVIEAFQRQPYSMLTSIEKINLVMNFWVNQLGWDARRLAKQPTVLTLSLEKRIIPRAPVVKFLLKNGLRDKSASLTSPFLVSDKMFLDAYIKRFKESCYLLNLYEENLKLADTTKENLKLADTSEENLKLADTSEKTCIS